MDLWPLLLGKTQTAASISGAKAAEPMEGACVYTEVKMRLVKCGAVGSEIAVHSHPLKLSDPQG